MAHVLSLGEEEFDKPEEQIRKLARLGLSAVRPSRLITDYGVGWNDIVVDEAKKLGIPYMGVLPYQSTNPSYQNLSRGASSNIVFFNTKEEFIKNPYPYLDWLRNYVGEIFVYLKPEGSDFKKNIIKALTNKRIRNIYLEANQ